MRRPAKRAGTEEKHWSTQMRHLWSTRQLRASTISKGPSGNGRSNGRSAADSVPTLW